MKPTLFQTLLGASFYTLPPAVRALHSVRGQARYAGQATIERGRNPLARLCARIAGLPPPMRDAPLVVTFDTDPRNETWQRDFAGRAMRSRLFAHRRELGERLGPFLFFRFALRAGDGVLHWHAMGARLFGVLPLPAAWFVDVNCRESEHDGRYLFEVDAALPLIGSVIRYEGWLEPASS